MIAGADPKVRNAFRATLREEPSSRNVTATQGVDAADVLEVTDLDHAIARAEEVIRARSSTSLAALMGPDSSATGDIFDALLTDDTAGPAVHAPYPVTPLFFERTTPIPASPRSPSLTLLPRIPEVPEGCDGGEFQDAEVPPRSAPILVLDANAFYHPAGRISEASASGRVAGPWIPLEWRLAWVIPAVLVCVALLAMVAVAALHRSNASSSGNVRSATALATTPERPADRAPAAPSPLLPVLDVNSLKSTPSR